MARVIDTPAGALWCSKMNAGALERRDQVVIGTDEFGHTVLRVADNRTSIEPGGRVKVEPGKRWIEFEGGFGLLLGVNEPVNRVTGSRSGGCC